ncbi:hypothetical protein N7475_007869 [Penicillium sp. IBT 31633x]|nr:hypothetical protein N7475_007869 [Penicillium sp. IBT 31633x]
MVVAPLLRFPPGMRCMSSNLYKTPINLASKNSFFSLKGLRSNYRQLQRFSTASAFQDEALDRTRNIGIIAHIDAGKTTTTERMLFYSGFTRRIGDVDEGSTVTDFLPAERARGITIQSAAITFHWPPGEVNGATGPQAGEQNEQALRSTYPHTINLIDTPGHADFTFEVMRSLRILDGAVCILDGVAGVEAQTEKVWNQATTYHIPRIIYIVTELHLAGRSGKLALAWVSIQQFVRSLGSKEAMAPFVGVADAINLQGLRWKEGEDGRTVKVADLQQLEAEEPALAAELRRARTALVELLSEHDEDIVEKFFECEEDHLAVSSADIIESLRRCVLDQTSRIVPLFAGASFRNMGVQPLLDSIVNLLPSPPEAPDPEVSISGVKGGLRDLLSGDLIVEQSAKASAPSKGRHPKKKNVALQSSSKDAISKLQSCALAFKVVNDAKRGVLVYVRVYSGSLDRNSLLFNTNLHVSERAPRLLKMYANDAVEVDSIPAGHIGVVVGLKQTRTGDTLVSYAGNKATPPEPLTSLQLRPIAVPPPVFFTSVEPHSLSEEKRMHESLALLLREDPSLHVTVDEESGQTLLSGMGELHLEIARDRLINDLKAKASMGHIEIGYRESALGASNPITKIFDKEIAGRKGKAGCTAVVEPLEDDAEPQEFDEATLLVETHDGNQIIVRAPGLQIDRSSRNEEETSPLLPPDMDLVTFRTALQNGAVAALARGPQFTFPMHNTRVTLAINPAADLFGNETTTSALSSAARQATVAALKDVQAGAGTTMMEPVMNVIISVDEASLGSVVHDISSSRGGHIISLDQEVPLAGTDASTSQSALEEEAPPPIDSSRVYAPPDPFEAPSIGVEIPVAATRPRTITAKVPLKEMVGYLKHLRSLTAGRGTFVMSVDQFENMSGQRQKAVLSELRGGF